MKAVEVIYARGHAYVQATHRTTLQITKDPFLTQRGDCVIAVAATKGALDLSPEFKETARREKARITIIVETDNLEEVVTAQGSPRLTFTHPDDLVVRKSRYVCSRTLAINANKTAHDLSRKLVEKLQNPAQKVRVTLTVETPT